MSPRRYAVETAVYTIILNIFAVQAALVHEILTKLLVNVVGDNAPAILSVHSIAKARRIDNVQSQSYAFFLNVQCLLLDSRSFFATLVDRCHLTILIKIGEEETVDECRLAQARLPNNHQRELEATFHRFSVYLIGQWCESNIITFAICKRGRKNAQMNALRAATEKTITREPIENILLSRMRKIVHNIRWYVDPSNEIMSGVMVWRPFRCLVFARLY